ncbi:MAG TPA: hydroxymethylbilane synthase [Vicinamibacterales bacterium]|nr:hydroxymethylbilane synthase [Vicinamibacterales bacterium]
MPDRHEIRIGTRGSQLALWQANTVADRIAAAGGSHCRIVVVKTSGDRLQEAPLSEIGGKRLFVKEIEDALLRGDVDIAVHSSKDMPAVLPDGLTIVGVLPREDPRDAVVLPHVRSGAASGKPLHGESFPSVPSLDALLSSLPAGPSIGTGSVRRIAQLKSLLKGGRFTAIRGNLDTRLRKLDEGGYDALVLAAAGLRRLGFASRISLALPIEVCVPAPGQGIVAIEARSGDAEMQQLIGRLNDDTAAAALQAERALVEALGGGCQTPIGAMASVVDVERELELVGVVASLDGSRILRSAERGRDPRELGALVAARLISQGASEILTGMAGTSGSGSY